MPSTTFADRLADAFALRAISGTMARVAVLENATGCSRRTAFRWLSNGATPSRGTDLLSIARALDVDPAFLAGTDTDAALISAFMRQFRQLTPTLQLEVVRMMDRLSAPQRSKAH